jgi:hypothetical protein
VLSVDEKSQIQALDRTQPGLPLKRGRAGTMADDYKRHGTTTLFAALNLLDGTVIGRNMQRHRHQDFIRFLNAIECEVSAGKLVHAILDNYAAHKHPAVQAWLARHPRWSFHLTPTSASRLSPVQGFFAILTKRRLAQRRENAQHVQTEDDEEYAGEYWPSGRDSLGSTSQAKHSQTASQRTRAPPKKIAYPSPEIPWRWNAVATASQCTVKLFRDSLADDCASFQLPSAPYLLQAGLSCIQRVSRCPMLTL